MVVPQTGSKLASRLFMFVVTMSVCLLWGGHSVLGAGCHVADRPVLTQALNWDHFPDDATAHSGHSRMHAQSAVVPPHCPGETPTLSTAVTVLFAPRLEMGLCGDPPAISEKIQVWYLNSRPAPLTSRLDRPPRHKALAPSGQA